MEDEVEYIGNMLLQFNLESKPLTQENLSSVFNRCIKDENGEIIGGYWLVWHCGTFYLLIHYKRISQSGNS